MAAIVVPGVGHFGATAALDAPWRDAICAAVARGTPLFGICVGMQWLFEGSDEAPGVPGLGALPGRIARLDGNATERLKVPHVGWNALDFAKPARLLSGLASGAQVYFTHSFAAPVTEACAAATTHANTFASVVERDNVFGVQFHPEKSSDAGLRILRNFLDLVEARRAERGRRHCLMLTKRIIACLDVRDGQVVKGVQFQELRHAGDPGELARRYNVEGIDEVVILDITATLEKRQALARTIAAVAREIFLPLTVGGGIRTEEDADAAVEAGADKVSLNTAALKNPGLITTLAKRYGSQAVIVAIDAKRRDDKFAVFVRSGTSDAARDAVEWAKEAEGHGAGEILLTSMDRDGTRAGFDCEMTAAVSDAVNIPVIASGGAGSFEHFTDVFTRGRADAALAASIFHYAESSVADLKRHLRDRGIPTRLIS